MLYTVYLPILLQQLDERRISVRYKCICRGKPVVSPTSRFARMSLTYFASTALSTSTKKTKPLCLQVGEHDSMPGISDQSCQILSSITMFQLCHAKFAY